MQNRNSTIFLVKSKLSTAKKCKTATFLRVFNQKIFDNFSCEIKVVNIKTVQNRVFSPQKNREINAKILNFVIDEPVWIMVKSYNSFLLDRLWIGTDLKSNPSDNDGRMQMQKYLFDHGLERSSFENMLRGMNTTRPFIPLQGQMYKGTIKGLKPDDEGPATTLVIEADVGELLFLEVPRENVFVYGHWMGKADLSYIFEKGKKVKILSKQLVLTKPLDKFSRETKFVTN